MYRFGRCLICLTALALLSVAHAKAAIVPFVANETGNSVDLTNFVTSQGATLNNNVNWSTHPLGALMPNFYSVSDGVTFSTTGPINQVMFGAGPGQANTFTPPLSNGEGTHAPANFLFAADGPPSSTLTITFSSPVVAAGFFTIDLFNPNQGVPSNDLTIQAFTGPDGTGTLLGTFHAAEFNFQMNKLYFMGVGSTDGDIMSIRLNDPATFGDQIGIGTILFGATSGAIPEPSTLTCLSLGALSLLGYGWRRRKAVA